MLQTHKWLAFLALSAASAYGGEPAPAEPLPLKYMWSHAQVASTFVKYCSETVPKLGPALSRAYSRYLSRLAEVDAQLDREGSFYVPTNTKGVTADERLLAPVRKLDPIAFCTDYRNTLLTVEPEELELEARAMWSKVEAIVGPSPTLRTESRETSK